MYTGLVFVRNFVFLQQGFILGLDLHSVSAKDTKNWEDKEF